MKPCVLNTFTCNPNKCSCLNGIGAEYKSCDHDGMHKCVACDLGFHLTEQGHCRVNECFCSQGFPALGQSCSAHDTVEKNGQNSRRVQQLSAEWRKMKLAHLFRLNFTLYSGSPVCELFSLEIKNKILKFPPQLFPFFTQVPRI